MNFMQDSQLGGEGVPGESGAEPQQMSLMSGIAGGDDLPSADNEFESMKTQSKFLNQGTMLMVIVALLAAGGLYAMRMSQSDMSTGAAAKELEGKIDQAIDRLKKIGSGTRDSPHIDATAILQDTGTILEVFDSDPTKSQVPVDYLKKNPFTMKLATKLLDDGSTALAVSERNAQRQAELRRKQLEGELSKFTLQSVVLRGRVPIAVIDNDLVREGQKVGSFTIKKIKEMSVEMVAEGRVFVLSMETDNSESNRR